ncbi:MAG: 1-deoxy-D-xylulose-5-phosphate reductoisomerase [Sphaerochaetaceae bacterium]|jgi:1-deoxy-D-xylulose-5-phosphate reductoisomerase
MESFSRSVILLGCTGSIGKTALHGICRSEPGKFLVKALSAHTDFQALAKAAVDTRCGAVCLTDEHADIGSLQRLLPPHVRCYHGADGLEAMLRELDADIVLNGIAGAAGLFATLASLDSGKDVALANKESVVMAGQFLLTYAQDRGRRIIPVDSEHSALYALIGAHGRSHVEQLILTASGGPFRTLPAGSFPDITVEAAIAHPTWRMGAKISIDSATLANKGLEVIEASYLFDFSSDNIDVAIHPQSIVHSLVRLKNGAIYAQMSPSDMTLPIMEALSDGQLALRHVVAPLDFTNLSLTFEKPDEARFPLLPLAFECSRERGSYCIAFNAADEVAAHAFLNRACSFTDINRIVEQTLQHDWSESARDYRQVLIQDAKARRIAEIALNEVAT